MSPDRRTPSEIPAMIARRIISATLVACVFITSTAAASEWPRFRGPNGSGVGQAKVPTTWTEADFNYRVELPGVGHSSPVIWGEQLFLTSGDEASGARIVLALDATTGRILWQREFTSTKDRKHSLNSFASSTPAVNADHVYIHWATPQECVVIALDHQGAEKWRVDLGPYKAGHGAGVSPIVHGDLVVINMDNEGESSIVALDRTKGEIRWRVPRKTKVSYSTPCVYQTDKRPAELIFTNWEHGIMGVDPATGRTNWELSVFDQKHTETSIGSPIVAGDLIFGTCGWMGYATHTVAVRPDASSSTTAKEVFRVDKSAPLTPTPIVVGGLLFLWADEGIVSCVDATTGESHWRKRVGGTYYGSPVAVGEHIYCASRDGEMLVLRAAKEYELVARNPLGEGSHSTPAIAAGKMFIRTFTHLISLGGK